VDDWIGEYAKSHRHPMNRLTHLFGIPMIVVSLPLLVASLFVTGVWPWAAGLFVVGWALQFAGPAIAGKPPEFFKDWRFVFVGLRWWVAKVTGKV
jgi:uncharacterized membrane protein YGL010W